MADAVDVLKTVREKYLTRGRWTRDSYYNEPNNTSCLVGACARALIDLDGEEAVKNYLDGDEYDAVDLVTGLVESRSGPLGSVVTSLLKCINAPGERATYSYVEAFNDCHSLPEVRKVVNCAIERLETDAGLA